MNTLIPRMVNYLTEKGEKKSQLGRRSTAVTAGAWWLMANLQELLLDGELHMLLRLSCYQAWSYT